MKEKLQMLYEQTKGIKYKKGKDQTNALFGILNDLKIDYSYTDRGDKAKRLINIYSDVSELNKETALRDAKEELKDGICVLIRNA